MSEKSKIRLYVEQPLTAEKIIVLPEEQSHYLCNVMRLNNGEILSCFNGRNGEFGAVVEQIHKKQTRLKLQAQTRVPQLTPDIWLLFAPLKKDRMDFLIEKAVELGVAGLVPVITRHTITDKIRPERLRAQIIEAAEQCERLDVPVLEEPKRLDEVLKNWNTARRLFFMDERGSGQSAAEAFAAFTGPAALLIGPEGGFSEDEAAQLRQESFVTPVSLGPRILRAETAAASALAVWQASAGDWRK